MIKFFVLLFLVFLDFLSKSMVYNSINLNNFIVILSFLDLVHIRNYGISFGLFSNEISPFVIILIGILIVFLIFYWMIRTKRTYEKWGLLLILSGAVSNISDRTLNNYVLDFIYLHYKEFYWPAFNFADIYITIGLLFIIYDNFYLKKEKSYEDK